MEIDTCYFYEYLTANNKHLKKEKKTLLRTTKTTLLMCLVKYIAVIQKKNLLPTFSREKPQHKKQYYLLIKIKILNQHIKNIKCYHPKCI